MQNRTIASMYPPGSLFKVVTGAAALEAKVMSPTERIFDSGKHWLVDKRNAQGEAFGWIDFYEALEKSDNVYFYEMGRRLGIDKLSQMAREFGLGKPTGIDLAGEADLAYFPKWKYASMISLTTGAAESAPNPLCSNIHKTTISGLSNGAYATNQPLSRPFVSAVPDFPAMLTG